MMRSYELQLDWANTGILITAEDLRSDHDWFLLKDLLFFSHAESYYGMLVEVREPRVQQGLFLNAWQAATYFAHRHKIESSVNWKQSGTLSRTYVQRAAQLLLQVLENGWFQPDFEAWQTGHWRFRMSIPQHDDGEYEGFSQLAEDRRTIHWFTAMMHELIKDPDLQPLWETIVHRFDLPRTERVQKRQQKRMKEAFVSEQEWLAAVGWRTDLPSVRFGLRLSDPAEGTVWQLQPIAALPHSEVWFSLKEFSEKYVQHSEHSAQMEEYERMFLDVRSAWQRIVPALSEWRTDGLHWLLTDDEALAFLTEWSDTLHASGVSVRLPEWWQFKSNYRPQLTADMQSMVAGGGNSLLGLQEMIAFDWRVALDDGIELSEAQFMELVKQKRRWIKMGGRWFVLTDDWIRNVREQLENYRRNGGLSLAEVLRHAIADEADANEQRSDEMPAGEMRPALRLDRRLTQWLNRVLRRDEIEMVSQPSSFQGTMYDYQVYGYNWLLQARELGFGACLADDMGLGKTIQLIAYFLHLQSQGQLDGTTGHAPCLLICPNSVLGNWQHELATFAPSLQIYVYHGTDRSRGELFQTAAIEADIVLTTYSMLDPHLDQWTAIEWQAICLDEAQHIKNPATKQSKAVRNLRGKHRIVMTGTPIENHLRELWSIFDFINPNYLGSLPYFRKHFIRWIERHQADSVLRRLQMMIYPFFLRREKRDPQVQLDLPEKHEVKVFVQLTAEQTALYENARRELVERVQASADSLQMAGVLQAITKYKQICDHPLLVEAPSGRDVESEIQRSNKLLRLLEMVEEIYERGERSLIFTQYTEMGQLIVQALKTRLKSRDIRLFDGKATTRQRSQMIADFQNRELNVPVLVLMIRAGGVGINLTAANHVFHYDRWWNPAVENQATDRVYRIGQSKDVTVYKLITGGTIEEKIDQLLHSKQWLSDTVMQNPDEDLLKQLSLKDWERLIL